MKSQEIVSRMQGVWSCWLLLVMVSLTGCAQFATVSETLFMMSPQEELQLGKQVEDQIKGEIEFVNDPTVVNYIRTIGNRIVQNSDSLVIEPQFYVIKEPSINAFAVPGGGVYVHTGLIHAANDEAELAGVIGHEVGHVAHRHGAKQVSRQMGAQFVEQLLLGDSGQAAQLVSGLIKQGVMFNYSREDERESDRFAVQALHRAGYDPGALRSFFQVLQDRYGDTGGGVMALFASHPPTSERMANIQQMVNQLPPKEYQRPVSDLRKVQGRLLQLGIAPE